MTKAALSGTDPRVRYALYRACGRVAPTGGLAKHGTKACEQARTRRRRRAASAAVDWRVVKDGEKRVKVRGRMVYESVVQAHRDGRGVI